MQRLIHWQLGQDAEQSTQQESLSEFSDEQRRHSNSYGFGLFLQMKEIILEIYLTSISSMQLKMLSFCEYFMTNQHPSYDSNKHHQWFSIQHFCRALIFDVTQRPNAKREYQKALEYDEDNPEIRLCLGYYLLRQRDRSAIQYFKDMDIMKLIECRRTVYDILKKIDLHNLYKILSRQQIRIGVLNCEQSFIALLCFAQQFHELIIRDYQPTLFSYIQLGWIAYMMKRCHKALDWAQKAYKIKAQSSKDQLSLGDLFSILGRLEQSLSCYQSAYEMDPSEAFERLHLNLMVLQRYSEAQRHAENAYILNKNDRSVQLCFARKASSNGNHQLAIKILKLSNKQHPDHYDTYKLLGKEFEHLGKIRQAISLYFRSTLCHPTVDAFNSMGKCLRQLGQHLNAIQCFKNAINLHASSLEAYILLSQYAQSCRNLKEFINPFMQSLKTTNQCVVFNLALYYHLSRQSSRSLNYIIKEYFEEKNNKEKDSEEKDNVYSDLISRSLIEYLIVSDEIKRQNYRLCIIIGILYRQEGQRAKSHQCFNNIVHKFKSPQSSSFKIILSKIMQTFLTENGNNLRSLFLRFFVLELVCQVPVQAIHLKKIFSLNDSKFDENFALEISIKVSRDMQRFCDVATSLLYKQTIIEEIDAKNEMKDSRSAIETDQLIEVNSNILSFIQKLKSYTQVQQNIKTNQALNINLELVVGIKYTDCKQKCYHQILDYIDNEERDIFRRIETYILCSKQIIDKHQLLKAIWILDQFYEQKFLTNQMVKLIYNGIVPLLSEGDQMRHAELAHILMSLKRNPCYNIQACTKSICQLFLANQKVDPQAETSSLISTINDFDGNDLFDTYQTESLNFDAQWFGNASFQKKNRFRKYSDSNIQSLIYVEVNIPFFSEIQQSQSLPFFIAQHEPFQEESLYYQSETFYQSQVNSKMIFQLEAHELNDQDYQQYQLGQKHLATYSLDNTKFWAGFKEKRLYEKLNQLFYENIFLLIKYLQKYSDKRYIATHQSPLISLKTNQGLLTSFTVNVYLGDDIFSRRARNQTNDQQLQWLWMMGPAKVLTWIADVASGISDLESLGILHADLAFRNTIMKVFMTGQCIFKIIDFDKAWKVCKTTDNDQAYNSTANIIKHWLHFEYGQRPRPPFSRISPIDFDSSYSSVPTKQDYGHLQVIQFIIPYEKIDVQNFVNLKGFQQDYLSCVQKLHQKMLERKHNHKFSKDSAEVCMGYLREHMKKCHLRQFVYLIQQLLHQGKWHQFDPRYKQKQRMQCIEDLKSKLMNSHIDYQQFAKQVRNLILQTEDAKETYPLIQGQQFQ